MNLEELINRYFDEGLDSEQVSELNELLGASAGARKTYWEIAQTHALLDSAMEEQSGEEWAAPFAPRIMKYGWLQASVAALVVIATCWWMIKWQQEPDEQIVATASDGVELLKNGSLTMSAGETREITFLNGARVALEGPLEVELISGERMKLLHGKIGVEVPQGAEGFVVETPDGEVIDFGTRFGLEVGPEGGMRAELFEGRIDVIIGEETHRMEGQVSLNVIDGKQELIAGSDSTSFPMPSMSYRWDIQGGFDRKGKLKVGRPKEPNEWSGDPAERVGHVLDVMPHSGRGMLQVMGTSFESGNPQTDTVSSQLWRVIDLFEVREKMGQFPERVQMTGWVNRVSRDANTDTNFLFGMFCHHKIADTFKNPLEPSSRVFNVIPSDSDSRTWERVDLQLNLPPGVRYLVIEVGAKENVLNNSDGPEFDGHFLDDISLFFFSGMRSSIKKMYWRGARGDWRDPSNWSEKRVPGPDSVTIVQGMGVTSIRKNVIQESGNLIVALDNESTGVLYLHPGAALELGNTEAIFGFNRAADALMEVAGTIITDGPIFIGRNNKTSTMNLSGSITSSNVLELSQFNSVEDTVARLKISGGSLKAQSLRMLNDQTSVTLDGGLISVEQLHLGGSNGKATIEVQSGEVVAKELFLGSGGNEGTFIQNGGVVRIETLHWNGGEYRMGDHNAELWIKMLASELIKFLPNIPRATRGEWTVFSSTL